jgi:hypothetical protein
MDMESLSTMTLAAFKAMVPTLEDPTVTLGQVVDLYTKATDTSTLTRAKIMAQTLLSHGADRCTLAIDTTTEFGKWLTTTKACRHAKPARISRATRAPDNAEHAQLVRIAKRLGIRTVPTKGLALRIIRHLEAQ